MKKQRRAQCSMLCMRAATASPNSARSDLPSIQFFYVVSLPCVRALRPSLLVFVAAETLQVAGMESLENRLFLFYEFFPRLQDVLSCGRGFLLLILQYCPCDVPSI
jgi:hypothetical protein